MLEGTLSPTAPEREELSGLGVIRTGGGWDSLAEELGVDYC